MCGGLLELPPDVNYAECPYCGSATTFPKLEDERKEALYNRAEHLRRCNDFDKAIETYEKILDLDDSDPEIYWGIVLCRYGIEYVEDPISHERVPTCHRVQMQSILADKDYQEALSRGGSCSYAYEQEAEKISKIQKDILAISSREQPFDVFICYKETTEGGSRTKDSTVAQDIYYQLTNEGYRVFFARITLEDKLGQQYEPYIFAALNSAKVMLVIGSKKEYFEAVWVKNEWSRFLALMKKDRSKLLIPCYKDMDAYDIPEELSMLQSQDMSKIGFIQDLLRGIKKVLGNNNAASPGAVPAAAVDNTAEKIQKLLKRAQFEKEMENYSQLYSIGSQLMDLDPDLPDAYFYQAMGTTKDRNRAEKLFDMAITRKPDRAEYYISCGKELYGFFDDDGFEKALTAYNVYLDADEDDDDDEFNKAQDRFFKCMSDIDLCVKCIDSLSIVAENKVPGVTFAESEQSEAKSAVKDILDDVIDYMQNFQDEELFDLFLKDEAAEKEKKRLSDWILLRSRYSDEALSDEIFINAIEANNMTLVQKYIDDGGDVNCKDAAGHTALGVAVLYDRDDIARYLVDKGALINEPSGDEKQTPLHLLYVRKTGDSPELARFLIENGADVNLLDSDGNTPLSLAFDLENISITPEGLNVLIEAGSSVDYAVGNYTPLITAARLPDKHELVRVLLEGGANFMLLSRTCGGTAMDYARGAENISYLTQVECPRMLNFDPIARDAEIEEYNRLSQLKVESPFQIKEFTLGSYIYSEIDGVIRPLSFMSDDDKANCPLGASMKVQNTSNKVIKYIHLELVPINDVDDPMCDSDVYTFTGPLQPGKNQNFRIESFDFDYVNCANVGDLVVVGAAVEFMDGTSTEVSGEAILLEKASISGASIANGLLEAGKIAKGLFDLFS